MMRKLLAFVVFNLYSACFVWAFQVNTAYQFDSDMIERLEHTGFDIGPSQWGWGNHYLWRLLAAVVATSLAGFLAGAMARTRGGITAVVSNIPSVAVWAGTIYMFVAESPPISYGDQTITSHTGMIVISLVAILLTTVLAHVSGESGSMTQRDKFGENTVLGIAGYHWFWLVAPIYLYSVASIMPITNFLTFGFLNSDVSIVSGIIRFVMLVIAVGSVIPLGWVYFRLSKPATTFMQSLQCLLFNLLILTIGFVAVALLQFTGHWLLGKFA